MNRPTFYHSDGSEIRAGGLLLYSKVAEGPPSDRILSEGGLHLLMMRIDGRYEDFGGQTDKLDESIEDTISREVEEETNKVIPKMLALDIIGFQKGKNVYIPSGKYMLIIREADREYKPSEFGDTEAHDNIKRDVVWFSFDEWNNKVLHRRLHSNKVYEALMEISES